MTLHSFVGMLRLGRHRGMLMKTVLFVCVENSNRSQMAEAFARMHGGDRVQAASLAAAGDIFAALVAEALDLLQGRSSPRRTESPPA